MSPSDSIKAAAMAGLAAARSNAPAVIAALNWTAKMNPMLRWVLNTEFVESWMPAGALQRIQNRNQVWVNASHLIIYTRDQMGETTPTSCGAG